MFWDLGYFIPEEGATSYSLSCSQAIYDGAATCNQFSKGIETSLKLASMFFLFIIRAGRDGYFSPPDSPNVLYICAAGYVAAAGAEVCNPVPAGHQGSYVFSLNAVIEMYLFRIFRVLFAG